MYACWGGRAGRWFWVISVPGHPTNLDNNRTRTYCDCIRCVRCYLFNIVSLAHHISVLSPSLWETARYRLKYFLQRPSNAKQSTNHRKSVIGSGYYKFRNSYHKISYIYHYFLSAQAMAKNGKNRKMAILFADWIKKIK